MKLFFILALSAVSFSCVGQQSASVLYSRPLTETYSQKLLLKNWAFSVCLAQIAQDEKDRSDANATASAYMEYGRQQIEAYDSLRGLVEKYTSRRYGGSIKSEFNTMKCIDLFHSKELENLSSEMAKEK